jgi:tetratricopeptide (TPR) repeat protein
MVKIRFLLLMSALAGTALAQNGSTLTNPNVRSPVGSGTAPVTSYQSGVVRTPNPIDPTSSMAVTGNVGGLNYFHGTVPYNAVSDFGGTLGSGTLDDFLRRSTIPQNYYSGGVAPYYSQTTTVTRIAPGTNIILTPPSEKIRTTRHDLLIEPQTDTTRVSDNIPPIYYTNADAQRRLMEKEQELMGLQPPSGEELIQKQQSRIDEQERITEELRGLRVEAEKLQQKLIDRVGSKDIESEKEPDMSLTYEQAKQVPAEPQKPLEAQRPGLLEEQELIAKRQGPKEDVYQQMQREYEQAKETLEQSLPAEEPAEAVEEEEPEEEESGYQQAPRAVPQQKTKPAEKESLSEIEILARAQRVLSERQSFAARSQDKFNQFMLAAEQYMHEGKFYKAVEAYSMASIYKPLDPLAYAGKSHALLAAGEYMSSAAYLNNAIEMFPAYVGFKIDLAAMIGDKDTLERRISDINAWIDVSSAPELQFLLAYIYMQLDRLDKAWEAVNAAYEKMPDAPAVGYLKTAIEQRRSQ